MAQFTGKEILNLIAKKFKLKKNNDVTIDLQNKEPEVISFLKSQGFNKSKMKSGVYTNGIDYFIIDGYSGFLSLRETVEKTNNIQILKKIIRLKVKKFINESRNE